MERHFSSKVNFQPDRSVPFTFRLKFRLLHSEMGLETRSFVNGTVRFGRTGPTGKRGPPPEVVPNIPVGPNRNDFSPKFREILAQWKAPTESKTIWPSIRKGRRNNGPTSNPGSLSSPPLSSSVLPSFLPSFLLDDNLEGRRREREPGFEIEIM